MFLTRRAKKRIATLPVSAVFPVARAARCAVESLEDRVLLASTGLAGAYFNNPTLTGSPVDTRIDKTINFVWSGAPGVTGVGADKFSVRWTGQVTPLYTGLYTFLTRSDDGVRLFVNGAKIIDNWTNHAATLNTGAATLTAGQKANITMEFYDAAYGATAQLYWKSKSQAQQIIPESALSNTYVSPPPPPATAPTTPASFAAAALSSSQIKLTWQDVANESLYKLERSPDGATNWTQIATPAANATNYTDSSLPASTKYYYRLRANNSAGDSAYTPIASATTQTPTTPPPPGSGDGLLGTYFDNMDFTAQTFTRVDPQINFNWGYAAASASMGVDSFSVRWTGQVQAQKSETYTFYTKSDDGVKLTINGNLVINKLIAQSTTEYAANVAMVAGQKYSIQLDYIERAGGANASLSWSSPTTAKQLIPQSQLFSGGVINPPPPPTAPATPASFTASSLSTSQIKLTWQDVSTETLYKLERSPDGTTNWTQIATPAANSTSYSDSNLPASTKFYYRLRANNAAGDSAYTPVASATTQTVTPPPPGSTYQPDALIQIHGETTFVGDNIYNTTGAGQAKTSTGDFYPRPFQIRVYNDGTAPDSFLITGPAGDGFQGNWRYQYYDSFVFGWNGAREITDAITGAGWNTGNIDPGQYRDFRIEILAPTAPGGSKITVNLVATSIHDPSRSDVVQAIMANPVNRGVAIRRQNFDAGGTYLMTIQNQGNLPDSFTINAGLGAGVGSTWNAQFFDDQFGGNDVSTAARTTGWQTRVLQPWESQEFRVVFTGYTDPTLPSVQITAASVAKPDTKQQTTVTISKPEPFPVSAATDVFPIGVWTQPVASFDKWQARGVNTLMDYQGDGATIEQWSQAARDRGMYYIRKPLANPADDVGDTNLLAWSLPDEPEIRSVTAATYAQWRTNWKAADPTRPILENFSGGYVIGWQGAKTSNDYIPYLNNTDWVSSSIYPVTAWNRPQTAGGGLDASGRVIDRLEQWSGGKPAWAVIEMDDQELPYGPRDLPSPTAGQFRATVWDSVIHGARGIVYFPESFNPGFKFDNTPNDVAAEMPIVAAKLQSIAGALNSDIDPVTRGLKVDGPLEGTWRIYNGRTYYVVLNFSEQTVTQNVTLQGVDPTSPVTVNGESRTLTLNNGTLTDTFAPFEVHVYQVG